MEHPPAVIHTGLQELGQHVVLVGSAHKRPHGKAHALCEVPCKDVAKVSRRHDEIHRSAGLYDACAPEIRVRFEIICHLRRKPADVDGVCARKAYALARELRKDFFDAALRVVKIAAHRAHANVPALLRDHLRALHLAHAAFRIKHHHAGVRRIRKARKGSLARVPARRGQHEHILLHAACFGSRRNKARQQAERHVLKCARRAVVQLQHMRARHRHGGRKVFCFKLAGISVPHRCRDSAIGEIGQQLRKDVRRERVLIQRKQLRVRKAGRGDRLRHIKAAVRRKAAQHRLCGCGFFIMGTGAQILHGLVLPFYGKRSL